jgi:hypothetical protein
MIGWMNRSNSKAAECSRLQKENAALRDDLADALARYQDSAAREREMFAKLFEAKQQAHEAQLSAATYRRLAAGLERELLGDDDIDKLIRDVEAGR